MGLLDQASGAQEKPQKVAGVQVSEEAQPFMRSALKIIYEENFEKLVKMIKASWPDGLPLAMSNAVNAVLTRLKKEEGMSPEISAEVGVAIFRMILEDLVAGKTIPQIDVAQLQKAMQKTLQDYVKQYPDEYDEEGIKAEIARRQSAQGGA